LPIFAEGHCTTFLAGVTADRVQTSPLYRQFQHIEHQFDGRSSGRPRQLNRLNTTVSYLSPP
jgi:hypothetical protein